MLTHLEKSTQRATAILLESNQQSLDTCGDVTKKKILRICPFYQRLSHVVGTSASNAHAGAAEKSAPSAVTRESPNVTQTKENHGTELVKPQSEAKIDSNAAVAVRSTDASVPTESSSTGQEAIPPVILIRDVSGDDTATATSHAAASPKPGAQKKALRLAWENDRVQEKTSMEILLSWLSPPKNYSRWKKAKKSGHISKAQLSGEINELMRQQGIHRRKNFSIRIRAISCIDRCSRPRSCSQRTD